MKLKTEYDIEDIVYIKSDPDQLPHTVIGIIIKPGAVQYELSYQGEVCILYNFELSKVKDPLADVDKPQNSEE